MSLKNYVIVLSYYVRPIARHCPTNIYQKLRHCSFLLRQTHYAALPYQCLKNYVIVLSAYYVTPAAATDTLARSAAALA